MNEGQEGHAAIKIDEQQILVMSGWDKCGDCLKTAEIYDSQTKTWEKGPDLNKA